MGDLSALFQPLTLRETTIRNRIYMTPHGNRLAHEGLPTPQLRAYYEARARGGVGMLATQTLAVYPRRADTGTRAPILSLWRDESPAAIKEMLDGIRSHGAKVAAQIGYAGRQFDGEAINRPPFAPSPIPWAPGGQVPREMTARDVERFVGYYADAARRAADCGYDAIEIHGAHGYLIHQFLSPVSNVRTDRYGGDLAGRARFAVEIATEVRRAVGDDMPVGIRLSGDEYVDGGIVIGDIQYLAEALLDAAELDYFSISAGAYRSVERIVPPMYFEQGVHAHLAAAVKKTVGDRAAVVASGRIYEPEFASNLIRAGSCDLVGMMRALIADPDLPRKAEGRVTLPIRHCVGLNDCWRREAYQRLSISCAVNPEVGREQPDQAPRAQPGSPRIVIVGAGPAGLEAAVRLAARGLAVTVLEEADHIGGQVTVAALAAGRSQLSMIMDYFTGSIDALGIDVRCSTPADASLIMSLAPNRVVLATGSRGVRPPWAAGNNVAHLTTALLNPGSIGDTAVIYTENQLGGGASVADTLAAGGRRVVLITPHPRLGPALEPNTLHVISRRLLEHGVQIIRDTEVTGWADGHVTTRSTWDPMAPAQRIQASTLLFDCGQESVNELEADLRADGYTGTVRLIGDAFSPRGIQAAYWDAMAEAAAIS